MKDSNTFILAALCIFFGMSYFGKFIMVMDKCSLLLGDVIILSIFGGIWLTLRLNETR